VTVNDSESGRPEDAEVLQGQARMQLLPARERDDNRRHTDEAGELPGTREGTQAVAKGFEPLHRLN
jgi:hypothetical protein